MVTIKSKKEIELMREVCAIVNDVYEEIEKALKPGMSTYDIDKIAENTMIKLGAIPAEKGYDLGIPGVPPYPASTCISINDEVIHGVPSKTKKIKEGDLVSIDTVALKNGFHGDAARSFVIGKGKQEAYDLVEVTKQAFFEGIKYAKPGYRIGDIGHAIETYVKAHGYTVVREFQGHGIGRQMHEEPGISNYGKPGKGMRIAAGMTLAIEPMVIQGKAAIKELSDKWTIASKDGSLAAHYENTVLITENEPEILTIVEK